MFESKRKPDDLQNESKRNPDDLPLAQNEDNHFPFLRKPCLVSLFHSSEYLGWINVFRSANRQLDFEGSEGVVRTKGTSVIGKTCSTFSFTLYIYLYSW